VKCKVQPYSLDKNPIEEAPPTFRPNARIARTVAPRRGRCEKWCSSWSADRCTPSALVVFYLQDFRQ